MFATRVYAERIQRCEVKKKKKRKNKRKKKNDYCVTFSCSRTQQSNLFNVYLTRNIITCSKLVFVHQKL